MSLDDEVFQSLINPILEDAISREIKDFKYKDYYRFRVSYIIESNFLFLFINSINDSLNKIEKELKRFKEEFFNLTNSTSYDFSDEQNREKIDHLVFLVQNRMSPIISLDEFYGVVK